MKALLLEGIENIRLAEVPKPKCSSKGALLKVKACGICGGDVRTYFHGFGTIDTDNKIMGHEITGEVIEVGAEHTRFKVGDRLSLAAELHCRECYYCRNELFYLCNDLKILGKHVTGGFSEYFHLTEEVITHGWISHIPENVSYIEAALSEPMCSVIYAQKKLGIGAGKSVLIIGGGPMGCMHAEVAKGNGAAVILSGRNAHRLEEARRILDINAFVNPRYHSVGETVHEITDGIGVDVVIVAAPSTAAVEEGVNYLRKGGKIDIFGGVPKDQSKLTFDSNYLHYNCIEVIGDFSYHPEIHKTALQMIADKQIDPCKFITVKKMEDFEESVTGIKSGKYMKVIMKMDD